MSEGLRYNEGKAPLEQIPLTLILQIIPEHFWNEHTSILNVIDELDDIQQTNITCNNLCRYMTRSDMEDMCRVFAFGATKYEQWNWTKGMDGMKVLGCLLRHLFLMFEDPDGVDAESGLPHRGHFWCNVCMLDYYNIYHKELFNKIIIS